MIRTPSPESHWRKSSYSGDGGGEQCVEYRAAPDHRIAVRDTKARDLGTCTFERGAWSAFVRAVRERHGPE
ncbi:DUF397 domain-containing protein [Streptomyces sp. URMC 126]|uniref:DUF397 domain-containing protein n=1 Tax=Streptomyces sp. URMC 126 TaxID=3423401 RepID=UPI003F1A6959